MPPQRKPANKFRPSAGAAGDRHALLIDRADRTYKNDVYDSIRERDYASELDLLKSAHDVRDRVSAWQRQVCVPLDVNGQHICNVFIDFHIKFADGRIEYHEVKGRATAEWSIKKKLFAALYPERKLKIIR